MLIFTDVTLGGIKRDNVSSQRFNNHVGASNVYQYNKSRGNLPMHRFQAISHAIAHTTGLVHLIARSRLIYHVLVEPMTGAFVGKICQLLDQFGVTPTSVGVNAFEQTTTALVSGNPRATESVCRGRLQCSLSVVKDDCRLSLFETVPSAPISWLSL